MVDRQALIDWPLTPYTGWGGYGIQLAQALLGSASIRRAYWPATTEAPFAICIGWMRCSILRISRSH